VLTHDPIPTFRRPGAIDEHHDRSPAPLRVRSFPPPLLEHRLVQLGLGQQLLQRGVLRLQHPKVLRLVGLHPAVLAAPAVPARLGHLQSAEHLGEVRAFVEQTIALTQLPHDLLGA